MKPLFVLLISFLAALFILKRKNKTNSLSRAAKIAMCIMLVFTGVAHFPFAKGMTGMLPKFIPFRELLIYATGVLEILFGIGLLGKYSKQTAWLLISFLICVLPANIYAAVHTINYQTGATNGHGLSYLWFRAPLQLFFIAWVYVSAIRKSTNKYTFFI
ncbi:DoxX family protein [Wenyingzhuangia sp. IMCC45574]